MFEYWFIELDGETKTGATHDFLEICCQMANAFGEDLAGEFLSEMLTEHADKLEYLRVIDWRFETTFATSEGEVLVRLHKHI